MEFGRNKGEYTRILTLEGNLEQVTKGLPAEEHRPEIAPEIQRLLRKQWK